MKAAAQAIEHELEALGFSGDECITILGVALTHFITRHERPHKTGLQFCSNLLSILTVTAPEKNDAPTEH